MAFLFIKQVPHPPPHTNQHLQPQPLPTLRRINKNQRPHYSHKTQPLRKDIEKVAQTFTKPHKNPIAKEQVQQHQLKTLNHDFSQHRKHHPNINQTKIFCPLCDDKTVAKSLPTVQWEYHIHRQLKEPHVKPILTIRFPTPKTNPQPPTLRPIMLNPSRT